MLVAYIYMWYLKLKLLSILDLALETCKFEVFFFGKKYYTDYNVLSSI